MEDDEGFASDHSYNVDDPGTPPDNVNPDEGKFFQLSISFHSVE